MLTFENLSDTPEVGDNITSEKTETYPKLDQPAKFISILYSVISVIFLCALVKYFNYGFDFTDEAFYLFMMERPTEYPSFHILSGFIYHPLYLLTSGNIFYLRVINFLLILAVSYNLCRLILKRTAPDNVTFKGIYFYLTAFQLSLCSSSVLLLWLPTPNYNLLNFMAIMITATGVLTLVKKNDISKSRFLSGWLIIALGGYLSFMARPFTAAFLGLLVFIWASLSKRFNIKGILLSFFAALAMVFITAQFTNGSISGLFNRFFESAHIEAVLGAHQTFTVITFRIGELFRNFTLYFAVLTILIILYAFAIAVNENKKIITLIFYIALPLFLVNIILNFKNIHWFNILSGYLLWTPVLGFIAYTLYKNFSLISKVNLPLFIFLLLLNAAYGMGSNNSFFILISVSAFFTMLALITFFAYIDTSEFYISRMIKLSALCLSVTIGIIIISLGNPYRQPPFLWSYSTNAAVRHDGSPLIMPLSTATYLNDLHSFAAESGLKDNTPMLDLSGRSPGTIYALSGYTPDTPWIYTGFPGIQEYAFLSLNKFTCEEISETWVILAENNISEIRMPEPINPKLFSAFGAEFPENYELVGKVIRTRNYDKNSDLHNYQLFFKPTRPKEQGISSCIAKKTELGLVLH
ncbi:MAG: hypothetical protein LBE27_08280 [Deltaproteobacteria bacterium]|jgi:hypothetical protein|nr:hypothetical protein [Deltaproteobacteria bacterium]